MAGLGKILPRILAFSPSYPVSSRSSRVPATAGDLLVDFIRLQVDAGMPLEEAVVRSAATRAQPIVLTALAAMLGAFFILDDPIFNGLAISLIFGIFVSTVLTLVVIPLLYFVAYRRKPAAPMIEAYLGDGDDGDALEPIPF